MVASALRDLAAPDLSHERDERRVKDRDNEDQCRNGQDRQNSAAAAAASGLVDEHRTRQDKADEHRPAVAHEDRCGVEIIDQESDQAADENGRKQKFVALPRGQETGRKADAANRRDPGGKPVHIVEQIYRVRDADYPKPGYPDVDDLVARYRHRQPEADQNGRPEKLPKQFLIRANVEDIVNEADKEEDGAAAEQYQGLAGIWDE